MNGGMNEIHKFNRSYFCRQCFSVPHDPFHSLGSSRHQDSTSTSQIEMHKGKVTTEKVVLSEAVCMLLPLSQGGDKT